MAGCRIQLQIVENRPAKHVRQEDIECDRRYRILPNQAECSLAAVGNNALEALVAGHSQ